MLRLIANKLGLGVRCCYLLASEEYMCAYVEESVEVFGFGWREASMMASFYRVRFPYVYQVIRPKPSYTVYFQTVDQRGPFEFNF